MPSKSRKKKSRQSQFWPFPTWNNQNGRAEQPDVCQRPADLRACDSRARRVVLATPRARRDRAMLAISPKVLWDAEHEPICRAGRYAMSLFVRSISCLQRRPPVDENGHGRRSGVPPRLVDQKPLAISGRQVLIATGDRQAVRIQIG